MVAAILALVVVTLGAGAVFWVVSEGGGSGLSFGADGQSSSGGSGFFTNKEDAEEIEDAFERATDESAIQSLGVYKDYAIVTVVEGDREVRYMLRKGDVDRRSDSPVRDKRSEIEKEQIPWSKVETGIVPRLVAKARAMLNDQGAEISHVLLQRRVAFYVDPRWTVYTKNSERFMFKLDGELVEAKNAAGESLLPDSMRTFQSCAEDAREVLEDKLGDDLEIAGLTLYKDYTGVEVRDPKNPENLDSYTVRNGSYGEPRAMTLWPSQERHLGRCVIAFDAVDLSLVPKLAEDALGRLTYDEGKVSHIILGNSKCSEKNFTWRVYVGNGRKSGYVKYDQKGRFVRAYD